MTIPIPTVTEKGIIAPTTDEVINGLWRMFVSAFGIDLNQTMNTPQGQLTTSLSASLRNRDDLLIQLMNQVDPQYSTGIWQDAIAKLYFLTRQTETKSTAQVTFYGLAGSNIPVGFQLQDQAGNIWVTTGDFFIGENGEGTGSVQCLTSGEIDAAPNTITIIVTALEGVERVTNTVAAVAGVKEESRESFEIRRNESVAANAKGTDSAVRGEISRLPNVVDVWAKSNPTDETVYFGSTNYPVIRNSILISVVGGVDYDIAWASLVKAGTGCSFNGNTEVTVTDNDVLSVEPLTYDIKFLRPNNKRLQFKVVVSDPLDISYDAEQAIKNAILDALKSGKTRARIAQNIRAVQYAPSAINATSLEIVSIEISLDDGVTWIDKYQLGVDEYPVTTAFDIEVG